MKNWLSNKILLINLKVNYKNGYHNLQNYKNNPTKFIFTKMAL